MNEFINFLEKETISTIEGLTGQTPDVKLKDEDNITPASSVGNSIAVVFIKVSGDTNSTLAAIYSSLLATALADLMVGGDGESKADMSEEDLDATKEITSNILGAISTSLNAQKDLPKLNFTVEDIQFYDNGSNFDLTEYSKLISFGFALGAISSELYFAVGSGIVTAFDKKSSKSSDTSSKSESASFSQKESHVTTHAPKVDLNDEEMRNINLLMDVKLPIKVRIGSKKMLLRDVINMDIGSVVELEQLA
ncbi:MAG: flagellar motor switch protein FliY, partial [Campylobacterales bacterium]|nr:flagellar motor switch protein FliY [Campylobacterales bacterium]